MTSKNDVQARLGAYLWAAAYVGSVGSTVLNSREISRLTGVNPTQVRRDLGRVLSGKRGVGYKVELLLGALGAELSSAKLGAGAALARAAAEEPAALNAALMVGDDGHVREVAELGALIAQGAAVVDRIDWLLCKIGADAQPKKKAA